MSTIELPAPKLTHSQTKVFGPKPISGWGNRALIKTEVRYDDECHNGHNTFAITGTIYIPGRSDIEAGGCLHEEIAKHFPELESLIKWHLCSSDGPMHYPRNAIYLAGDRDCWGRAAGEPSSYNLAVKFGDFPILWEKRGADKFIKWLGTAEGSDFEVIRIEHDRDRETFDPNYTLGGAPDKWHECPFDTEDEGLRFLQAMQLGYKVVSHPVSYSKGKARELDAARRVAIWPEATDEDLTAPGLKERLEARLPKLLEEFKSAVESLGFTY